MVTNFKYIINYLSPYDGCGKKFNGYSAYKKHLRSHTGECPYECDYPNCGKKFTQVKLFKFFVTSNYRYLT